MRRLGEEGEWHSAATALLTAIPVPACLLTVPDKKASDLAGSGLAGSLTVDDPPSESLVIASRLLQANAALYQLLGFAEGTLDDTALDALTTGHSQLHTLSTPWETDLFATGLSRQGEDRSAVDADGARRLRGLRHANGHTVWVTEDSAPCPLANGVSATLLVLTDMTARKITEDALAQRLGLLRRMFERLPAPMFIKDAGGRFVEANTAYLNYSGVERQKVIGRTTADLLSQQVASSHMRIDYELIDSGGHLSYEEAVRFADEQTRLVCISKAGFELDNERGVIGVVHDLIEGMPSEARLQAILEQSPIGVSVSRRDNGKIIFANSRFAQLVGEKKSNLIGRYARDYYLDSEQRDRVVARLRENKTVVNMEIQFRRADGSPFWTLFTVNQAVIGGVAVNLAWVYDYTDRWHMQEALRDMASRDPLTGIYNRRSFLDLARQHLSRAGRSGEPVSILLLDVDHFKAVNDTWGHAVGDDALRTVAGGCQAILREYDLLGRFGGEEFIIMLPGTPINEGEAVAERVRRHIAGLAIPPPEGSGLTAPLQLTISIGVAQILEGDEVLDKVIHRADLALYRAKNAGRNRVEVCAEGGIDPTGS